MKSKIASHKNGHLSSGKSWSNDFCFLNPSLTQYRILSNLISNFPAKNGVASKTLHIHFLWNNDLSQPSHHCIKLNTIGLLTNSKLSPRTDIYLPRFKIFIAPPSHEKCSSSVLQFSRPQHPWELLCSTVKNVQYIRRCCTRRSAVLHQAFPRVARWLLVLVEFLVGKG